tara:strand:- start:7 stop:279 length:273 start_codon:yes stop_codon:yes gene_type:complete
VLSENDFNNPELLEEVQADSQLKEWLVEYVGNKFANPDSALVNVEMITEVFAKEFPEFLLAVAEENWVRGYHQALEDINHAEDKKSNTKD